MTEVTQADRECAVRIMADRWNAKHRAGVLAGEHDNWIPVQEVAKHRINHTRPASTEPVDALVVDLGKEFLNNLLEAAAQSSWIPPEYHMNDWVSDCCDFLRDGPALTRTDAPKQRPWCETCGKDVHEVLCPTCAKWWNDNPPPTEPGATTMQIDARTALERRGSE